MQYDPTNELILLTGVRKDGAISYFIRAVSEDDAAAYARAYACLLETDEQNDFYGHVAHAVLFDDNLFASRCFPARKTATYAPLTGMILCFCNRLRKRRSTRRKA